MADDHLSDATLRRFFRSELSGDEHRAVVRHLLAGCARCAFRARLAWDREVALRDRSAEPRATHSYGDSLPTVRRGRLTFERERLEADRLHQELAKHPATRQLLLVRNGRRFRSLALCERILRQAFELGFDDPRRARSTAELGLELARQLSPERYGRALVADMNARAWATVANARRIGSDLTGAEEAFRHAEEHLEDGTGDPLEAGQLLTHKAYLRTAQRRFTDAKRMLDRALANYYRAGDRHLVARTRINRGGIVGEAGELATALRDLRSGLREIDSDREPRMAVVAHHNLILFLLEAGEIEEALERIPEARRLHERLGNAIDLARLHWLEAKLDAAQGRLGEAEEALEEVIDAFLEREMVYPAAIAAIDLAAVYLRQRRLGEIGRLVEEILPVFRGLGIGREALAAVTLLVRAVEKRQVSLAVIAEAQQRLHAARRASDARRGDRSE